MHELSIAENLLAIVLEVAGNEKLKSVTKVNVSFGRLAQVVPELFETAFQVAAADTIAENAELEIEMIPVTLKCLHCCREYVADEISFLCRHCGSAEIEIVKGREMYVSSIEGE